MNHECKYPDHNERLSIIDAKIVDIDRRVEMLEAINPLPSGSFWDAINRLQDGQNRLEKMMSAFQAQLAELAAQIALHQTILSGDQAEVVRIKAMVQDRTTRLLCAFGLTAFVVIAIFFKPTLAEITSFNVVTYASCGWLFGEGFMNFFAKKVQTSGGNS
jgi:hypothetical protein